MATQSLGGIIKAAVLAGLIAGAAAAGFHWLLTEPVIERAIKLEERLSQAHGKKAEEPVVSRETQRLGLILGFLLYGGAWGFLFGTLYYLAQSQLPAWSGAKRGFALAVALGWSVAIFPFLKYPANPPGVGDSETIGYRQGLYLGFIALSFAGTVLAVGLERWLKSRNRSAWPAVLALYIVYLVVVYAAMPANPNPVRMPTEMVWKFRTLSLTGLALFWVVIGGAFGWLCRERGQPL